MQTITQNPIHKDNTSKINFLNGNCMIACQLLLPIEGESELQTHLMGTTRKNNSEIEIDLAYQWLNKKWSKVLETGIIDYKDKEFKLDHLRINEIKFSVLDSEKLKLYNNC